MISSQFEKGKADILPIISNILYCSISIILITYFKDIFFSLFYILILLGYIFSVESSTEYYCSIVLLVFSVLSILLTVYKYKNTAIGYANSDEISQIMLHHDELLKSQKRQSQDMI